MKKIMLLLGLAINAQWMAAQEKIVILKPDHTIASKISKIPFSTVTVLDNRIDTSKIGMAQVGGFNKVVPAKFNEPAPLAIQHHIDSLVSGLVREPGQLIFSLERMQTIERSSSMSEKGYILFSAKAYLQTTDTSFALVSRKDTLQTVSGLDVTAVVFRGLARIIDNMILDISGVQASKVNADSLLSYEAIISSVRKDWSAYPIKVLQKPSKGLYRTFDDFRMNRVDTITETIFEMKDSVLKIKLVDAGSGKKKKVLIFGVPVMGNSCIST